ncbi:MAG: hypothetical protein AAF467_22355 [Actinomycetota bacterium]
MAFPATVAVEWLWIGIAGRFWDGFRFELVDWAGWTIDPFVEEVVRLSPMVLVAGVVARTRRQWSLTDWVVLGAGVGSGFRLAEHVARHASEPRGPLAGVSENGSGVGWTFDATIIVPDPQVWLSQWMPEGVQADAFFGDPDPFLRYNLVAVWGTLAGLAVGLWSVSARQATPVQAWLGRALAVGLVVFAGLAHAQANADLIGVDWVFPALAAPRFLARWYWAWPLVVLVGASLVDRQMLRSRQYDPRLDAVRVGPLRTELFDLVRLSLQQPMISAPTVWAFVRVRRTALFTLARSAGVPADRSAADGPDVIEPLKSAAAQLRRQLHQDHGLWAEVAAAKQIERRERWSAWSRSPRVWLFGATLSVLALVPIAHLVAGTSPGGYEIQRWLSEEGSALTVGAAVLGTFVGVVLAALGMQTVRRASGVMAEPKARAVMSLAVTVGAVGSMLYGLIQIQAGAELDTRVYSAHGLDALGSLLWSTGLNLGLLALVVVNPTTGWPTLAEHHRFKSPDELIAMLPWPVQVLAHVGHSVAATDGRAVPGEWENGPKPPTPLDAELDVIVEHAWDKHVASEPSEFPEVQTPEELKELLEEVIEGATEWGHREDGSVYWYDEVTDTVVIKNPPGVGGTTYRPGPGEGAG